MAPPTANSASRERSKTPGSMAPIRMPRVRARLIPPLTPAMIPAVESTASVSRAVAVT